MLLNNILPVNQIAETNENDALWTQAEHLSLSQV